MSPDHPAGYSGKPVWQKLGLKPGMRVRVQDAPRSYADLVGIGEGVIAQVGPRAAFDLAHVFAIDAASLATELEPLAARLPAAGVLWISWPKKASRVSTDIVEDTVRAIALPLGLVDVKVCAIDAVWSGLKLVWRLGERAGKA